VNSQPPEDLEDWDVSRLKIVESGLSRVKALTDPDLRDELEEKSLELARLRLKNANEQALIDLRKTYGTNMIRFLWVYFLVAIAIIISGGLGLLKVPESVSVALVGGTAVSVLGVVGTIVAGLFRVRDD
jgi:hypothetical protein